MSRLIALGVRIGNATDEVGVVARTAPRHLRSALAIRRYRRVALAALLTYLVLYLAALGDIDVSTDGTFGRIAHIPSVQVVPDWSGKLFAERAPFLYERVAAVYVLPQLALFISVGNILVGFLLGLLLALSVALALYARSQLGSCEPRVYASAIGVLPSFLMGFACCAPTLILALGTTFAAAILPIFIPLRGFLLPLAVFSMLLMLLWNARKLRPIELARGTAVRLRPERWRLGHR